MRGDDEQLQTGMFSYVALEDRIPLDHPLRGVRKLVDAVLAGMSRDFDGLYSEVGRPSIAPERLLRALLLQVFYSVRSERLLMEQLNYNLLFRWFVGLEIDDAVWNHAVFSKNRERLLNQELAQKFFAQVKGQAEGLMSDEHFTVDGTLIEAWAGQKSFRRKDKDEEGGSGSGSDFHGETRRNQTHVSSTDPEARLYKKSAGQEAKLCYLGHTLVENRNGLIAAAMTTQADGRAERDAALLLLHEFMRNRSGKITAGADRGWRAGLHHQGHALPDFSRSLAEGSCWQTLRPAASSSRARFSYARFRPQFPRNASLATPHERQKKQRHCPSTRHHPSHRQEPCQRHPHAAQRERSHRGRCHSVTAWSGPSLARLHS
jgi:transposase